VTCCCGIALQRPDAGLIYKIASVVEQTERIERNSLQTHSCYYTNLLPLGPAEMMRPQCSRPLQRVVPATASRTTTKRTTPM
jgi:hypothetical protein